MKKFLSLFLVVLAIFAITSCSSPISSEVVPAPAAEKSIIGNGPEIIAYFTDWSIYGGHDNYDPGLIPFEKISIINFSFTSLYDSTRPLMNDFKSYTEATFGRTVNKYAVAWLDKNADIDKTFGRVPWGSEYAGVLGQLKYYKEQYPHLKVVPSVGGWTKGNLFDEMSANAASRAYFVESAIAFIREYNMDGVDIDWEYPGIDRQADPNDQYDWGCPGSPAGKQNFTLLMKDLREGLDAAGVEDNKTYILTAAVGIGYDKVAMTELDKYPQYMDYINLMTYDMHGAWDTFTGHQAPIVANPAAPYDPDIRDKYNVTYAIDQFVNAGVPASKLTLGLPFYSRGWGNVAVGDDANLPGLHENGGDLAGKWGPGGQSPYFEIKNKIASGALTAYYDPASQASYAYGAASKEYYTFDTKEVIQQKSQIVLDRGLGGAMIWEIDGDTWKDDTYELTNAVYDILYGGVVVTPTPVVTSTPVVVDPTPTSTPVVVDPTPTSTPVVVDPTPTSTPVVVDPTATPVVGDCTNPAWEPGTYTTQTVHHKGHDWKAQWWTTAEPGTEGPWGSWKDLGECGTVVVDPTPTSTPVVVDPTPTNTPVVVDPTPTATTGTGPAAWAPGTTYAQGDVVSYGADTYECRQPHTAIAGWDPPYVASLWLKQ